MKQEISQRVKRLGFLKFHVHDRLLPEHIGKLSVRRDTLVLLVGAIAIASARRQQVQGVIEQLA
jgi:hypothetical protein